MWARGVGCGPARVELDALEVVIGEADDACPEAPPQPENRLVHKHVVRHRLADLLLWMVHEEKLVWKERGRRWRHRLLLSLLVLVRVCEAAPLVDARAGWQLVLLIAARLSPLPVGWKRRSEDPPPLAVSCRPRHLLGTLVGAGSAPRRLASHRPPGHGIGKWVVVAVRREV